MWRARGTRPASEAVLMACRPMLSSCCRPSRWQQISCPLASSLGQPLPEGLDREASLLGEGGGPLLTDLLGGQVPVSFNVVSDVFPHARSGKLRILAVTSPKRWRELSDVPTMVDLGYKEISFVE